MLAEIAGRFFEMTPKQCRMARIACDWKAEELAAIAHVASKTVFRFEQGFHTEESEAAPLLRAVFEKAGVEFISDYGVHYPSRWNVTKKAA
jgi:DNA-binding XRE family transcriptional regulator